MSELSPAAQAVDDAFWKTINDKWNIYDRRRAQLAAALRAAADQVVPESYDCAIDDRGWVYGAEYRNTEIRWQILAIADELETQ
jgi:hypothetical protein